MNVYHIVKHSTRNLTKHSHIELGSSNKAKRKFVNVKTATNGSNQWKWAYWAHQGICRATRRPTRTLSRYATGGGGNLNAGLSRVTRGEPLNVSRYATRPSSQNLYKTKKIIATLHPSSFYPNLQATIRSILSIFTRKLHWKPLPSTLKLKNLEVEAKEFI